MSEQSNDIEKLIRLKRYEKPKDGYFEDFLREFQSRQRSELLQRSARGLFLERVGTYFSDFSRRQWILAGSAAYAAVTIGFFLVSGWGAGDQVAGLQAGGVAAAGQGAPQPLVSAGVGSGLTSAMTSAMTSEGVNVLWDEPRIVLLEEDSIRQEILDRQQLMSSEAEWDVTVLRTSAQGGEGRILPVQDARRLPDSRPVTAQPVGLEL